jgi:hypothetical protein
VNDAVKNPNARALKAVRTVLIGLLGFLSLCSIAFMILGLMMDGMRHTNPAAQSDSYYFECFAPAIFFCTLFGCAVFPLDRSFVWSVVSVAHLIAFAWLVSEFRELQRSNISAQLVDAPTEGNSQFFTMLASTVVIATLAWVWLFFTHPSRAHADARNA